MTNGYMVYLLRILAAQGALASVYTDPEDPEGFSAGFVEAVDGQHVLMCDLSPWGQIDGWRVRRNQDVIQVLAGEEYEQRLAMLLAYHKQHHRPRRTPICCSACCWPARSAGRSSPSSWATT